MPTKRVAKYTMVGAAVLVLIVLVLAVSIWRSPPFYADLVPRALAAPIMTMAEYGEIAGGHDRPYVVEIESANGAVLLYGATHTKDPTDPQIHDLSERWAAFEPTVALVEGRLGFFVPYLMDPVRSFGETGAVHALARRAGIPTYTWEPPRSYEIGRVLSQFPAERVALFYVLRPYFGNVRHGKPNDPEGYVEEFRRKRTKYPGLEHTLGSVAEIDTIWWRDFPGVPDWRDTSDEFGLPGYLDAVAATSNAVRDEHLVAVIIDLAERGERVFAVAGSSHSVKVEGALRASLSAEQGR